MRLLELTLPTPPENLALDEALLDEAEDAGRPCETLRFWEPAAPMVVVGRSSRVGQEVDRAACARLGIPILRRPSGGAAVVAGPGCLMYSLVLSYVARPALRSVDQAHRQVLNVIALALQSLGVEARCRGTSDLVVGARKFSGNSVRCRRTHLLYHGTLLYRFPLDLIATVLPMPPRTPAYREGRGHTDFVMNLPLPADALRAALAAAWKVDDEARHWPRERTATLLETRYRRSEWHEQW